MAEVIAASGDGRDDAVARAVEILREGGLVVVPTDTVYGLAADAFDRIATTRIASAKRRDRSVPLAVFIRSPKQLIGLTPSVPAEADRLMAAYWPGPLTMVLRAEPGLRWDLGDSAGTVAVRMPLDEIALAVVRAVGPLAVTGASRTGAMPPATVEQARAELGDDVDLYLDAGPRDAEARSTIVDLTRDRPRVLRSGVLPDDQVLAVARGELDPLTAASSDGVAEGAEAPAQGSGGGIDRAEDPTEGADDAADDAGGPTPPSSPPDDASP